MADGSAPHGVYSCQKTGFYDKCTMICYVGDIISTNKRDEKEEVK